MGQAQKIQHYTRDEYLAMEAKSEVRHEYINGELFAMVGASRTHALLVTHLVSALDNHLCDTSCRVMANDMKVFIEAVNRFYYPDVLVSCSDRETEPDEHYETAPLLVVEVLSTSTESTDRREKRFAYQTLESLQEYVLIAQSQRVIEVFRRQDNAWVHVLFSDEETVILQSIDLSLPMASIYRGMA